MSPDPDLEVRWLVHTTEGPQIISVRTRSGVYVASLIGATEATLAQLRIVADTAADALDRLVQTIGGTAAIPLPPHSRRDR